MKKSELRQIIREEISNSLNEQEDRYTTEQFIETLSDHMKKYLPKDRWTIEYDRGDIIVTNDFNEQIILRPIGEIEKVYS